MLPVAALETAPSGITAVIEASPDALKVPGARATVAAVGAVIIRFTPERVEKPFPAKVTVVGVVDVGELFGVTEVIVGVEAEVLMESPEDAVAALVFGPRIMVPALLLIRTL